MEEENKTWKGNMMLLLFGANIIQISSPVNGDLSLVTKRTIN